MRKLMIWLLVALMALSGLACAEGTSGTAATAPAVNGGDAVRVGADLYLAIPDGTRQMLVRVPDSGTPVCVDRGDRFEDLMPYAGGIVYLKTENNSTAIMSFNGTSVSTVYGFGSSTATCLSYYGGRLLVLIDGLLHSIEPSTQLCLRLSGSAMLDFAVEGDIAYFLSAGDRMEYTATLEGGQTVSTQAGCVYSLDLNTGSTMLLLKSGATDLKVADGMLYFHNLANAYAVRTGNDAQLKGYVYSLDATQHTPGTGCSKPDSGFWAMDDGKLVIWYDGALNMDTEAGTLSLYNPENGATVVSDGQNLYAWESGKQTLTRVGTDATATTVYTGDLTKAADLSLAVPASASTTAAASPSATSGSDTATTGNTSWFNNFMDNQNSAATARAQATPIGATATPKATPVPLNNGGSSSSSTWSSSSGSSSGSSSSSRGTSSSGSTYSVNIKYVEITGSSVNVRKGPGTRYEVLGVLKRGTIVECTGKASEDSGGNTWYQLRRGSATGWVSAGYAKKSSGPDLNYVGPEQNMGGNTVTVTGATVNVRSTPNLNGKDLGVVKKGTTLSFLGKVSTDARGVNWYKVSYKGNTGWVSSKYSSVSTAPSSPTYRPTAEPVPVPEGYAWTTGNVNLRAMPGREYPSYDVIPAGTRLRYTTKAADPEGRTYVTWYYVNDYKNGGWVSSAYLTFTAPSTSSTTATPAPATPATTPPPAVAPDGAGEEFKNVMYTTGDVNVRSGPGTNYEKINTLPRGTKVQCERKTSDGWYSVPAYGGWVSGTYLSDAEPSGGSNAPASGGSSSSEPVGTSGTLYTTGSVNVRDDGSLNGAKLGVLGYGTAFTVDKYKVDDRGVTWYHGSSGNLTGWVSATNLSSSQPAAQSSSGGGSSGGSSGSSSSGGGGGGNTVTTTGSVYMRSEPSRKGAEITVIPSGTPLTYTDTSKDPEKGRENITWYKVSYQGSTGWVSDKNLR